MAKKCHWYRFIVIIIYWLFFQHEVPPGKHAIITVRQPKGDLLWIQTVLNSKKKNDKEKIIPEITTWDDCDIVQVSSTVLSKHKKSKYHDFFI